MILLDTSHKCYKGQLLAFLWKGLVLVNILTVHNEEYNDQGQSSEIWIFSIKKKLCGNYLLRELGLA